jgi:hypothetical protein
MSFNNNILVCLDGSSFFPSNTVPSDVLTISKANDLFVNEHGDDMKGILDMKNNKIINVAEPTDIKDATTKKYVDDSVSKSRVVIPDYLTSDVTKDAIRHLKYDIISKKYGVKFWISGFYNNLFQPNAGFEHPFVGSTTFSKDLPVENNAILFKKDSYIVSDFQFGDIYTFIGIVERTSPGRVFTSLTGNKFFGYWQDKINVAWHDGPIITKGIKDTGGKDTGGKRIIVYMSEDIRRYLYNNNVLIINDELLFNQKKLHGETW